jgi:hypothetical protein
MFFIYMFAAGFALIVASFLVVRKHYMLGQIEWTGEIDADSANYPRSAKWMCNLGYLLGGVNSASKLSVATDVQYRHALWCEGSIFRTRNFGILPDAGFKKERGRADFRLFEHRH